MWHRQPLGYPTCKSTTRWSASTHARLWRHLHPCQALRSYYEVLEIETDASEEDIRSAFRKKARTMHPDVNKAPGAEQQFIELKKAYDTLSEPMLRSEHDAQLGLPSARARDPRFARFERWRREVVPDLRMQLEVWTNEVELLIEEIGEECSRMVLRVEQKIGQLGEAVLSCSAQSSEGVSAAEERKQAIAQALREVKADVALIVAYAGDVTAQVQRLYDKRYDQVSTRYPAYPDLVWYDIWEEVSDEWLRKTQQRSTEWRLKAQEYSSKLLAVEAAFEKSTT